jgi:hypothetical protein
MHILFYVIVYWVIIAFCGKALEQGLQRAGQMSLFGGSEGLVQVRLTCGQGHPDKGRGEDLPVQAMFCRNQADGRAGGAGHGQAHMPGYFLPGVQVQPDGRKKIINGYEPVMAVGVQRRQA